MECTISVINYTHLYTVPLDINDDMNSSLHSKRKQLGSQVPRDCFATKVFRHKLSKIAAAQRKSRHKRATASES